MTPFASSITDIPGSKSSSFDDFDDIDDDEQSSVGWRRR